MTIHVLPGDAYVVTFRETGIAGDIIICRECLIDGPVNAPTIDEFFDLRADFIEYNYDSSGLSYRSGVASELRKLDLAPKDSEVCLWFEHELFCQANLWFCLSLLHGKPVDVFRAMPKSDGGPNTWKGFGDQTADEFLRAYGERRKLTTADISLGADLWDAYSRSDYVRLIDLSSTWTASFPYLKEVCAAAVDRETKSKGILKGIVDSGIVDFPDLFRQFSEQAGVYGFGDSQVKRMLGQ
ncbi:MAG: hypothetical protein WBD22_02295 [Pyrinomonadaceae bacterium]